MRPSRLTRVVMLRAEQEGVVDHPAPLDDRRLRVGVFERVERLVDRGVADRVRAQAIAIFGDQRGELLNCSVGTFWRPR